MVFIYRQMGKDTTASELKLFAKTNDTAGFTIHVGENIKYD